MSKLAYFEWSASDDAEHDDPEAWAQANPALGIRISEDFIETERGALEADDFARERLGIFPEEVDTTEPVIPEKDWRDCADPKSRPLNPVAFAFEVSIDRRWACIGSAGRSSKGGTHVELVDNRRGTGWVVDRLLELQQRHSPTAIICNPAGPAGALLTECEKKKLVIGVPDPDKPGKYKPPTGRDYAQACGAALDDITEHRWRHLGDNPALNAAVSGAAKRSVGDAFVFDRRAGVDISPLVAVTLAAWAVAKPTEEAPEPFVIVT